MFYGLTGGMGAGKSAVSAILKENGFTVIDADEVSREVMKKGSPLLRLLVKEFGVEIINEDGKCNRRKLAEIAFADKDKTRRLNELVQTAILVRCIEKVYRLRQQRRDAVVFFDVPLLYEAGWDCYVDKTWLVCAPESVRVSRIMERDGLTEGQIMTRLKLQNSEESKRKKADVIIENDGDLEHLKKQVEVLIADLK